MFSHCSRAPWPCCLKSVARFLRFRLADSGPRSNHGHKVRRPRLRRTESGGREEGAEEWERSRGERKSSYRVFPVRKRSACDIARSRDARCTPREQRSHRRFTASRRNGTSARSFVFSYLDVDPLPPVASLPVSPVISVRVKDNYLGRIRGVVGDDQLGLAIVSSLTMSNGDRAGPAGSER